jgi:hypothetical protein
MNALFLTLFVSLGIVVLALLGFGFTHRQRDLEHADRLSLLPLEDDDVSSTSLAVPPAKTATNKRETDR